MFLIHTVDEGHIPGYEYLPAAAIVPKIGMALTPNASGQLAAAAGTTAPKYVCMAERETAVAAGDKIPVIRAEKGIVFETTFTAAAGSVKVGAKVTLSADGLGVTGTTEGGVAEVVAMDGTASGDVVRVRFN